MLGVVGVLAFASGARYFLVMTLGERIVADLRRDLFAHLSKLDASFYDTAQTGELISRLTADTTQLKSTFGSSASVALRNLFLFIGAVIMMVVSSPKLSVLVLVLIPLIVLPLVLSGRAVGRRSRAAQDRLADATAFAAEHLGAVRAMQAFGAETATRNRYASAIETAYSAMREAIGSRALLTAIAIFLAFASVVGVLWLGAHDVIEKRMSGGLLSQFVLYAILGASALGELSQVWGEVSAAAGAAGRIAEILAIQPRIMAPAIPAVLPSPVRGEIRFEAVDFTYPTRPEGGVLHSLTFAVRPGETVALVGPSGAGKTTVFQLLMRFYDPTSGRILVDGVPIETLDPAALRATLGLVPQDPVIFSASIAENISFGRETIDPAGIEAAASQAAAGGFVEALPQGYETRVGERGVTLSGGAASTLGGGARHPEGRAGAVARRGHLRARCRKRTACSNGPRRAHARPHDVGDRAPARDRRQGRPHPGSRRRPDRRAGDAYRTPGAWRALCQAGAPAVRGPSRSGPTAGGRIGRRHFAGFLDDQRRLRGGLMSEPSARLYLITPVVADAGAFAPKLEAALGAGDVACLLLRTPTHDDRLRRAIAETLAPLVQQHGTALLLESDTRAAASAGADGVHVMDGGEALGQALRSMKPDRIVGVGRIETRDDAMLAGESGADYLMFGDLVDRDGPHSLDERLDWVAWWAEIFQVPCVARAYALSEVQSLAAAGAEFVALEEAVWDDARGPAAAVLEALSALRAADALRAALGIEQV